MVGPLLKKYGFGATFYVCEFPGFEDKTKYMTWEQIRELSDMGFEIGNHSRSHGQMSRMSAEEIEAETAYIEEKCAEYGIPHPVTYAYPGTTTVRRESLCYSVWGTRWPVTEGINPTW